MINPSASLEVMSARAEDAEGTIAFVVRDHLNAATVMAFFHSDLRDHQLNRVMVQGSVLPTQRNECIQRMGGDFLLFIDDDMVWQPTAIADLIDSYQELKKSNPEPPFMLGGLCFRRTPPYQPTLYVRESPTAGAYNFLEEWPDGIVEVDATGCAFLLLPVDVIEKVMGTEMPSFEVRAGLKRPPEIFTWTGHMGEDIRFSQDVKAAGCQIFVDTRIEIGHISEVEIRKDHFYTELANRSPRVYAERLIANRGMGLHTVTPSEARSRIG